MQASESVADGSFIDDQDITCKIHIAAAPSNTVSMPHSLPQAPPPRAQLFDVQQHQHQPDTINATPSTHNDQPPVTSHHRFTSFHSRMDFSSSALLIHNHLHVTTTQHSTPAAAAAAAPLTTTTTSQPSQDPSPSTSIHNSQKKKRPRTIYQHGNYKGYYGYRLGNEHSTSEDPRLDLLTKSWFAKKRCLDIGCNEGVVTLGMVSKFHTKSMVGLDIDEALIKMACANLKKARSQAVYKKEVEIKKLGTPAAENRAAHAHAASLSQTWFIYGDVLNSELEEGSFDTVTCLSVTKWVHINKGDEGLKELFSIVWRALAPGGHFIVEPQPWKSYQAARGKLVSSSFVPLNQITLVPDSFVDYLCDEVGFTLVKRVTPETAAAGFDRSIIVLKKSS
jgi:7SK snRNA methylphosphate capping enzyme